MTVSDEAIDEAATVYAAILDDPQRAAEIRAARERYVAERERTEKAARKGGDPK